MDFHEFRQQFGREQWDIAVGHHDGAFKALIQLFQAQLYRTSGARDLVLIGDDRIREDLQEVLDNAFTFVAYHCNEL